MEWLAVFIGGGLGSLARFAIARLLDSRLYAFIWATPVTNLISCVILGVLLGLLTKSAPGVRIFWMVGFCGGFSTFSTFTAETYQYVQEGQWFLALINIFGSVIICFAGLILGIRLAG